MWLAFSGAVIGFNWILLFEAYNYTTVAVATLCYYMQPTIVVLLSPFVFNEKLTPKKAVCAGIAISGMILVSGVGGGQSGMHSLAGIAFGLGAAALYAAVVMMNKKISGVDAYEKTMIQLGAAAFIMVPYLFLTGGFKSAGTAFSAWVPCLVLIVGLVHTGIAYVLYFASMDGLRTQTIAMLSYIDPVTALLLSAVILHEGMTLRGLAGALLILGAAFISGRDG
jgi:RarD protein